MKRNHLIILGILALIFVAWLVLRTPSEPNVDPNVGANEVTRATNRWEFTNRITVGPNGGAINEMKSTICNLATYNGDLAATSTEAYYCAITGVASGDQVYASLPSVNAAAVGGFVIAYTKASTTPDGAGIEVGLLNLTGAATSTFPLATTSVQVLYFDN